ncbi:hypothetical protein IWQ51_002087 [Labrenzia sp. EL_142]|nr:hypothetical protein [Labrenzia sp. EL_142]
MAALAKVENSGVDEFVTLVKSGILTTEPENGLDAVNQYNDYKTLVALLGELFPTSPLPHNGRNSLPGKLFKKYRMANLQRSLKTEPFLGAKATLCMP